MKTHAVLAGIALAGSLGIALHAAPPVDPYHRTVPHCIDGNCVPNREFNGFYATRWRQWPGNELDKRPPANPIGVPNPKSIVPSPSKELNLPGNPSSVLDTPGIVPGTGAGANNGAGSAAPRGGGLELPPNLQNPVPDKPREFPLPGLDQGSSRKPLRISEPFVGNAPVMFPAGNASETMRLAPPNRAASPMRVAEPLPLPTETVRRSSFTTPEQVMQAERAELRGEPGVRITSLGVRSALNLSEGPLPTDARSYGIDRAAQAQTTLAAATPERDPPTARMIETASIPNSPIRLVDHQEQPRRADHIEPSPWKPRIATTPVAVNPEPLKISVDESTSSAIPLDSEAAPTTVSPLRGVSRGNPLRGGR